MGARCLRVPLAPVRRSRLPGGGGVQRGLFGADIFVSLGRQACAQTAAGGDDAAVGHSANPVLRSRCASERRQLARLRCDIAPAMVAGVPWRPHEPEGVAELRALLGALPLC